MKYLERLAGEVRRRARLAPDEIALAPRIAVRLLGASGVARVDGLSTTTYLVRLETGYRIVARAGAPDLNWAIAHEIGHWALAEIEGFSGSIAEEERHASYLGTAIIAPRAVVRAAHVALGNKIARLANLFRLSQKSAWLRLGETLHDERAIVNREGQVRVRTAGAYPWDDVDVLGLARGTRRLPGLVKTQLRGGVDRDCVALRAR